MFDDHVSTIFRDVITLALAGFVAIVILILPWVNPPGKKSTAEVRPPGDLIFESRWPDGINTDVDQWIAAPGDQPVGYSNKGTPICNLLRDDLGTLYDPLEINYEITVCRGVTIQKEYIMNLHLFRNIANVYPIDVKVAISIRKQSGEVVELLRSTVPLRRTGQEITVARFQLTNEGGFVPGSLNSVFRGLRSSAW